jgi:hypothetical protein
VQDQSNGFYNSDQLTMLSRVLTEAVAATINSNGSAVSDGAVEELTSRLGQAVIHHFIAGETDPEMLKTMAIRSVQGGETSDATTGT